MIARVSVGLALYEAFAIALSRPTISDLSHRWPYSIFVWSWLVWLTSHFLLEARR